MLPYVHLHEESQPLQKASGVIACSVSVDDILTSYFFINTVIIVLPLLVLPLLVLLLPVLLVLLLE